MKLPTKDELRTLATTHDTYCASIYLPTHRTGRDLRQDPIRLKNLLGVTEEKLVERGLRGADAREMLQPARQLFDDELFWRHLGDGLALFLTRSSFQHYNLPLVFQEQAIVNSRFYVKPMLPLLNGDGLYYVMVLSQKEVHFLEGSRYSIREVDVGRLPKSLAAALKEEEVEKHLQFHTRSAPRGGGGERDAMFYGHGSVKDEHKDRLLRFFRQINQGLHDFLRNKNAPLVLAGVEYYLPIYKEANTYAHLMDKVIHGNHAHDNLEELHKQSWKIAEPIFAKPRQQALEQLSELAGTDKSTTKLGKILPLAFQGRIATLFVTPDKQRWGKFDQATHQIVTQEKKDNEGEDLFDLAAVQTFLNGGKVYVVDQPNGVLQENDVAAIFRY